MYEPLWSTETILSAVAEAAAAVATAGMLLTTPGKNRTGGPWGGHLGRNTRTAFGAAILERGCAEFAPGKPGGAAWMAGFWVQGSS